MPYKDPEKAKAHNKAYRLKNRDKLIAKNKEWRIKNSEKVKLSQRKWQAEHRKQLNEYRKNWEKEHPDNMKAILEHKKDYNKNHPEKQRVRDKRYRLSHPEKMREHWKKQHDKHPYSTWTDEQKKNHTKMNKEHRQKNPQPYRDYQNNWKRNQRLKILKYYSQGTLSCAKCGVSDIRILTLDHVKGGGRKQLRENHISLVQYIINNHFPEEFQVICWNCQFIKADENNEWENKQLLLLKGRESKREQQREHYKSLRLKVLNHYSNGKTKCARCGFSDIRALTIDHIAGGGCDHVKQIRQMLVTWLAHNDYPEGFQILCMNCQKIKTIEKGELPHSKKKRLSQNAPTNKCHSNYDYSRPNSSPPWKQQEPYEP